MLNSACTIHLVLTFPIWFKVSKIQKKTFQRYWTGAKKAFGHQEVFKVSKYVNFYLHKYFSPTIFLNNCVQGVQLKSTKPLWLETRCFPPANPKWSSIRLTVLHGQPLGKQMVNGATCNWLPTTKNIQCNQQAKQSQGSCHPIFNLVWQIHKKAPVISDTMRIMEWIIICRVLLWPTTQNSFKTTSYEPHSAFFPQHLIYTQPHQRPV